jgi:hypothetical protein
MRGRTLMFEKKTDSLGKDRDCTSGSDKNSIPNGKSSV